MTLYNNNNKTTVVGSKLEKIQAKSVIIGFPGAGLVGSITSRTISEELDLKVMGYIRSPLIPPQATFFDGILSYPYRIYSDTVYDLAVIVGETPLSLEANYNIAYAIMEWAEKNKSVEEIIVVDGFISNVNEFKGDNNPNIYLVAEPDILGSKKFKKITNIIAISTKNNDVISGYIGGVAGVILNESIISSLDGFALLSDCANPDIVNVMGAANTIDVLNRYLDIDVDNSALINESEKISTNLKEMASKTRNIMQSPEKKQNRYYT